jgi:hypothetical protein
MDYTIWFVGIIWLLTTVLKNSNDMMPIISAIFGVVLSILMFAETELVIQIAGIPIILLSIYIVVDGVRK